MAELTLVTGGARSGKSRWAQLHAESLPGERVYVATCPVLDDEMIERVARHQADRSGRGWHSVEEPVALPAAVDRLNLVPVVLIDCLTLWISNLLFHAEAAGLSFTEDDSAAQAAALVQAIQAHPGQVLVVTNEVGQGIVPENALARRFRDLAGRCNQTVATAADRVILMVAGCPLVVKGTPLAPAARERNVR